MTTETELLEVAVEAAREAAAVHRVRLGTVASADWTEKGVADFVTEVDHESEQRALEVIRTRCPDHGILAEESSGDDPAPVEGDWLWIVDPLDGTTNYLHGYPAYAVSVAVTHHGELVAGVVIDSGHDDLWTATRGGGARLNGEAIRASSIERLDLALIGTGFPFKRLDLLPAYLAQFDTILRATAGIRRAGAAALDLCWLAAGRLDGFWELWLASWDVAAGTLIAREAGAIVTRMNGSQDVLGSGTAGAAILGGNASIYRQLRTLLDGDPP